MATGGSLKRPHDDSDEDDMMQADAFPTPTTGAWTRDGSLGDGVDAAAAAAAAAAAGGGGGGGGVQGDGAPMDNGTVAGNGAPEATPAALQDTDIPNDLLSEDLRLLLESMDEFVPTIPESVTTYFLHKAGFNTSDPRMYVRAHVYIIRTTNTAHRPLPPTKHSES